MVHPRLANRGGGVAVEGLGDGGWHGRAVWLEGTAEGGGVETAVTQMHQPRPSIYLPTIHALRGKNIHF
ncbi:MAG: hypothetical protein OT477_14090 [Chloroflexi bacterium]|nr:hypothetical protein [Chloroflexota bacterium]